jgi:hypothetical protein
VVEARDDESAAEKKAEERSAPPTVKVSLLDGATHTLEFPQPPGTGAAGSTSAVTAMDVTRALIAKIHGRPPRPFEPDAWRLFSTAGGEEPLADASVVLPGRVIRETLLPCRDDVRLFLEGGFIDLVENDAGGSYHGGLSAIDGIGNRGKSRTAENAKQECLHLIETQTVALHALLFEFPELEDDPSGCAGRESDDHHGAIQFLREKCTRHLPECSTRRDQGPQGRAVPAHAHSGVGLG